MKKYLYGVLLTGFILGMAACNSPKKLASKLEGKWVGEPTEMVKKSKKKAKNGVSAPQSVVCTPTFTFSLSDEKNPKGGNFTLSSSYVITQSLETTEVSTPVNATISGIATASGTWTATSDDEVLLTANASKTSVVVDPNSLNLTFAKSTDTPASALLPIKERMQSVIADQVSDLIKTRVANLHKLDDVKLNDNLLKLEISETKIIFTKAL